MQIKIMHISIMNILKIKENHSNSRIPVPIFSSKTTIYSSLLNLSQSFLQYDLNIGFLFLFKKTFT